VEGERWTKAGVNGVVAGAGGANGGRRGVERESGRKVRGKEGKSAGPRENWVR